MVNYYNLVRKYIIQSQAPAGFRKSPTGVTFSHWTGWVDLQRTNWKHTFTRSSNGTTKGSWVRMASCLSSDTDSGGDSRPTATRECPVSPPVPSRLGAVLCQAALTDTLAQGALLGLPARGRWGLATQARGAFRRWHSWPGWLKSETTGQEPGGCTRQHTAHARPAQGTGVRGCRALTIQRGPQGPNPPHPPEPPRVPGRRDVELGDLRGDSLLSARPWLQTRQLPPRRPSHTLPNAGHAFTLSHCSYFS